MRRIPFITGGALGLCVAAAPCAGTTITFDFQSGQGVGLSCTYWYKTSGGVELSSGTAAKQLVYKVTDVSGTDSDFEYMEGKTLSLFCVDLFDRAQDGTGTVVDLNEAPVPEGFDIGTDRANLIMALYTEHYDDAIGNDATKAAGFQAAIWEIAFEGGFDPTAVNSGLGDNGWSSSGFDTAVATGSGPSGYFGFSLTGDYQATIAAKAAEYAQDAWDRWYGGDGDWWHLYAAGADGFQDLVIIPIPLPAPIALAGIGLLGVLAGRRKLTRLVK